MTWNVSPIIFSIGSFSLRWYGLLFALTFFLGFEIMKSIFARENVSLKNLDRLLTYMVIGTAVGARLGHCLIYEPEIYLRDPIKILKIWEGGLASHGGAAGIAIAMYLGTKNSREIPSYLWLLDRLTIPISLGACFIRIGNLMNSEIVGRPTTVPWAITFLRVDSHPRHPTQIYEAVAYLLTFVALSLAYRNERVRNARGLLLGLMFILIFTERIAIEFFKEVQVGYENSLPLDLGQLLSIPLVVFGFYLVVRSRSKVASQI